MSVWEQLMPGPVGVRFEPIGAPGEFAVRAEIPGVNPDRDIRVSLTGETLRVDVHRNASPHDQLRTEFHYGASSGSLVLPDGIAAQGLAAAYQRGVLTIVGPTREPPTGEPVPIRLRPRTGFGH